MTSKLKSAILPDLFVPPEGTTFDCGIWATHDLDGSILSDIVIPRLAGVTTRDAHRGRIESRKAFSDPKLEDFGLIVLAAGGQMHKPGPALPSSVHVVDVKGRLQHAKFGVLWFKESMNVSKIRLVVTSANLTRSGLSSNYEICWSRDFETAKMETSIVSYLLAQSEVMIEESGHPGALALIKDRRYNWHGLERRPAARVRRPKWIHSTLTVPGELLKPTVFTRSDEIVIVSPAFQGDNSKTAAENVSRWASGTKKVSIYTGAAPDGSLYFSDGIINAIEDSEANMTLNAVSSTSVKSSANESDSLPQRRMLHAKLLASIKGTRAKVLVGSANLTDRALSGQNRELMIELDLPAAEFYRLIDDLPSDEISTDDLVDSPVNQHEDDEPSGSLKAEFEIAVGSAEAVRWRGRLQLHLETGVHPTKIEYRGEIVTTVFDNNGSAEVSEFQLIESLASLDVFWPNGVSTRVPIVVNAPDSRSGFWQRIGAEGRRPSDVGPNLLNLLTDIDKAISSPRAVTSKSINRTGSDRDGYSTPLDNRLIELVRARHRLHVDVPHDQMLEGLKSYLKNNHKVELECAEALLSAVHPDFAAPEHRLLKAFANAAKHARSDEVE